MDRVIFKSKISRITSGVAQKRRFLRVLLVLCIFPLLPALAEAAVLYLEPAEGNYHQGDTFVVSVRIDVADECVNAVEADLSFPQDILQAMDFSQGGSILSFWVKPAAVDNDSGVVSFAGGIPGGFCGLLLGDPGKSNLLGKIIFQVKETGREQFSAEVKFLASSQVLLNDGEGTPAKLTLKEAIFTILPEKREVPEEQWKLELAKDNIPPEPFKIEIVQDPLIFDGKYFIVFQTQDKQTGINYYEVKEGRGDWKRIVSPYLLENQELTSIIKVKAVDKAGNERIAEYNPKEPFPYWIIIVALAMGGIIWWIKRKWKNKKDEEF